MIRRLASWACVAAMGFAGCYRPVIGHDDELGPFSVAAVASRVAESEAQAAVVRGARSELARVGQLGGAGAPSAIVVEVLRVQTSSAGVIAVGDEPAARSVRVVVTGRGRVFGSADRARAQALRDTGDVVHAEVVARPSSTEAAIESEADAVRRVSSSLGARIVQRLLLSY